MSQEAFVLKKHHVNINNAMASSFILSSGKIDNIA